MTQWKGWKAVTRDVIILWIFTGIGGFIIGIVASGSEIPMLAIGVSNIVFGVVGFCISGCIVQDNRWKHLVIVAVFVWLSSIINVFISPITLIHWVFGILPTFIMMGIGGGLSFIFKKPCTDELIVR